MAHPIHLPLNDFRDHLLPRLQAPGRGPSVPVIEGVVELGLYIEEGGSARPVTQRDLDDWGKGIDVLMPYAVANVRCRSRASAWMEVEESPGVRFYASGDGLGTSRMALVTELVTPWPQEGVIVAAPAPDLFLLVPLNTLDDVQQLHLLTLATHYAYEHAFDGITDQLFWFDGETWSHVQVEHNDEATRLSPPAELLEAIERLAAMQWVKVTAEA